MYKGIILRLRWMAVLLLAAIGIGDATGQESYTDDYLMPSLEELLGEPVDDFGEFNPYEDLQRNMVTYAKEFLGRPYVHGGKGPNVFDCSGFTSFVYRKFGYPISPASRMQGTEGERVKMDDVAVGDLIFFSGRGGGRTVGHVGMVIEVAPDNSSLKFIHASTKRGVTIQQFPDGAYYSSHFLHIQRILREDEDADDNAIESSFLPEFSELE